MTKAIIYTLTDVAPFTYASIIFAALLSWIFWQDIPDIWTVVGTILVVCGAIATIMMQKSEAT